MIRIGQLIPRLFNTAFNELFRLQINQFILHVAELCTVHWNHVERFIYKSNIFTLIVILELFGMEKPLIQNYSIWSCSAFIFRFWSRQCLIMFCYVAFKQINKLKLNLSPLTDRGNNKIDYFASITFAKFKSFPWNAKNVL